MPGFFSPVVEVLKTLLSCLGYIVARMAVTSGIYDLMKAPLVRY